VLLICLRKYSRRCGIVTGLIACFNEILTGGNHGPTGQADKVQDGVIPCPCTHQPILSSIEVWSGPGNCTFTGASVLDPWHKLPVVNMIASTYLVSDFFIEGGKILETL